MRGHVVSVKKRDVGRGLHSEPHRVDLRKMGSVRRRKAEKGDGDSSMEERGPRKPV